MFPKASLGGGMLVLIFSKLSQTPVHDSHKDLGEWGRYGYASEVIHVGPGALAFVQRHNLGIPPRLWCQLAHSAGIEEVA